jgi:hypothetical protein
MLFRVSVACARFMRPTDVFYTDPSAILASSTGVNAVAGIKILPLAVGQVIDISDALEIQYLLAITFGSVYATPATSSQAGKTFYVAADGITLIDPATLAAVDTSPIYGMSAPIAKTSGSFFVGQRNVVEPDQLGATDFPLWIGYSPALPLPINYGATFATARAAGLVHTT